MALAFAGVTMIHFGAFNLNGAGSVMDNGLRSMGLHIVSMGGVLSRLPNPNEAQPDNVKTANNKNNLFGHIIWIRYARAFWINFTALCCF